MDNMKYIAKYNKMIETQKMIYNVSNIAKLLNYWLTQYKTLRAKYDCCLELIYFIRDEKVSKKIYSRIDNVLRSVEKEV